MRKNRKKETGITLVALVVTIVILIILASISISLILNGGLIGKTEKGSELHGLQAEKERLELIKVEVASNLNYLGKVTVDDYIQELVNQGIVEEDEITDGENEGSKNVITDKGYNVIVEPRGDNDIEIIVEGEAGKLPPKIKEIELVRNTERTSLIVTLKVLRAEGTSYKYYYRTEGESYGEGIDIGNNTEFEIEGILEDETYTIKVEATNEYGSDIKEKTESVAIGPNGKPLVTGIKNTNHETIEAEDSNGNKVVVPGGFKVSSDSGKTVEDGIVIEDDSRNQFVWIPVSNINHNGEGKIKRNNGDEVEITLGRYTFNTTTGAQSAVQYGSQYASAITLDSQYQEKVDEAANLAGFVNSVSKNNGFFLGRYEACFASGSSFGLGASSTYYKPASKPSTSVNTSSTMTYSQGTLWNQITVANAKTVSQQMYYDNLFITSDLVNSYMWDTAIVFIQSMGHQNYANKAGVAANSPVCSGSTTDVVCNINDMALNLKELTTETTTNGTYPRCIRGGSYYSSKTDFTAYRERRTNASYSPYVRFPCRVVDKLKEEIYKI